MIIRARYDSSEDGEGGPEDIEEIILISFSDRAFADAINEERGDDNFEGVLHAAIAHLCEREPKIAKGQYYGIEITG